MRARSRWGWAAADEALTHAVVVRHGGLARRPAEVDELEADEGREVHQAALGVLEVAAELLELRALRLELALELADVGGEARLDRGEGRAVERRSSRFAVSRRFQASRASRTIAETSAGSGWPKAR